MHGKLNGRERHQGDIVASDDKLSGIDEEVVDKVKFPGLQYHFKVVGSKVRKETIRSSELANSPRKSRKEVASTLVDVLLSKPNISGFAWDVGSSKVEIFLVENGSVTCNSDQETLLEVLYTALRYKPLITSLKWELDKAYLEIASTNI